MEGDNRRIPSFIWDSLTEEEREELMRRESQRKHLTKEDFFHRLDRKLSREERDQLATCTEEELANYHFGLGTWIRNTWIHGGSGDLAEAFAPENDGTKEQEEDLFLFPMYSMSPDTLSSEVIKAYWQYLREKKNPNRHAK